MKLSVIIPVFNTSNYLETCIKSLLNQNFEDMEIICVEDCSSDSSNEILQKYKEKIVILNNENTLGSGISRNRALEVAKGEYILFVDSDDWLVENSLHKILAEAEKFKPDVLIFGGLTVVNGKIRSGRYSVNKIPKKYKNRVFSLNNAPKDIFKFPSTSWTKLYKREFLFENNIKFQNVKRGQDQIFFVSSMLKAEKIKILDENLYCYQKNRRGSISTAKNRRDFSPIEVFYAVEKFLVENNIEEKEIIKKYFLKAATYLSKTAPDFREKYFIEYKKLLEFVQLKYGLFQGFDIKISDSYFILKLKIFCYLNIKSAMEVIAKQ